MDRQPFVRACVHMIAGRVVPLMMTGCALDSTPKYETNPNSANCKVTSCPVCASLHIDPASMKVHTLLLFIN